MFIKDEKETKKMFMDLVQCKLWELIRVDADNVVLKREGKDKILNCPRTKFNALFTPFEDDYMKVEVNYGEDL